MKGVYEKAPLRERHRSLNTVRLPPKDLYRVSRSKDVVTPLVFTSSETCPFPLDTTASNKTRKECLGRVKRRTQITR